MTVGMVTDYGMRFQYDYHCAVVAGLDEHAQDFVDKWKYIDMHMIDEFKVRRLYTNSGEIVLGYKEKSNQGNKDAGTINTMYIRTVNKNPGVLKGKFCNDIIMEESGENELLLETIQASEDCLRAGQLQVGTFLIYGCVCAGTKVWDSFGNFINIEELKQENGIIGFNERLGEHSKENITYWQPPFKKTCYKITTSTGRVLECSEDHPILSRPYYESKPSQYRHKRFIETKNLRVGDRVATIESIDVWGDKKMFDPRLIGWLVGDGTYGKAQNITLCNADFEIWRYLESKYEIVQEGGSYLTKDRRVLRKCRILGIMDKFMEVGIRGQTKDNKRLPPGIHSYCKEDVCEFLGGYFDADGCAYTNNKTTETFLKLTSANYEILNETRFVLQKLGIRCNILFEKPNFNNPKTTRGHYNLIIKDKKSIIAFHENISFYIVKKQEKLEAGIKNISKAKSRISDKDAGLRYERIASIENIGIKDVYNLTAGTTNTYVANGIVTHNTGGNMSKGSAGYKHIHHNLGAYNAEQWYIPAQVFYFPHYAGAIDEKGNLVEEIPNLLHLTPEERVGLSDFDAAIVTVKAEKDRLLRAGDMEKYFNYCQNNPIDIKEIFRKTSSNNFNIQALNDQLYLIESGDIRYHRYKLQYKQDDKGMNTIPIEVEAIPAKREDPEHDCVYILNDGHPVKGFRFLDVAGNDSYDQDQSKTSKSLGAMVVFRKRHNIPNLPEWLPVALIRNRPRYKEQFYELSLKLSIYYELIDSTLVDRGAAVIMQYYKNAGMERYLSKSCRKFESPNTTQTPDYGQSLNNYSLPKMVSALQTYFDYHVHKVWFKHILDEALNYDEFEIGSDNDTVDALGLALMKAIDSDIQAVNDNDLLVRNPYQYPVWGLDSQGNVVDKSNDDVNDEPLGEKEDMASRMFRRMNVDNPVNENDPNDLFAI